jgi:hypothetical protein
MDVVFKGCAELLPSNFAAAPRATSDSGRFFAIYQRFSNAIPKLPAGFWFYCGDAQCL